MPLLFSLQVPIHRGTGARVLQSFKASVPSEPCRAIAGVYDSEAKEILIPDRAAVRAALPHYWRKAFDRQGGSFWFDSHGRLDADRFHGQTPYLTLRNHRGQVLATIYAIPYRAK